MIKDRIRFILRDKLDGQYITIPENKDGLEILMSKADKTMFRNEAYVFSYGNKGYSDKLEEKLNIELKKVVNPDFFDGEPDLLIRFEVIWIFGFVDVDIYDLQSEEE